MVSNTFSHYKCLFLTNPLQDHNNYLIHAYNMYNKMLMGIFSIGIERNIWAQPK